MTTESGPGQTWASPEAVALWQKGAVRRARALAEATEHMLDAAGVQAGLRVLDIAAGAGDQSLLAARRVGPTGAVLATDISANMLEAAAQAATEAGLENVTTRVADASALEVAEESFDAAISRFGLMFMPDLHEALERVRRALKPGARFAALVWSTEDHNPFLGLQLNLLRQIDRLPSPLPTLALTVSLSGPGVLEHAFAAAGFRDVRVSAEATPREFASLDEALTFMRTSSPAQAELWQSFSARECDDHAAELTRQLQAFAQADGRCVLPGEALLGVGAK